MKSQISVFILLGLVLALFFGGLFVVSNSLNAPLILDTELSLQRFAENCVENSVINYMYYYDFNDLELDIPFFFDRCFENIQELEYRDFNTEEGTYDVILSDDGNYLSITGFQPINNPQILGLSFGFQIPLISQSILQTSSGIVVRDTTISSSDNRVSLQIPQGTAISDLAGNPVDISSVEIKMVWTELDEDSVGFLEYHFFPKDISFSPAITYSHILDPDFFESFDLQDDYFLEWVSSQGTELIPATFDLSSSTVFAEIDHFSISKLRRHNLGRHARVESISISRNSAQNYCQNWDNDRNALCPSGYSNCDCRGHCGTRGSCDGRSSSGSGEISVGVSNEIRFHSSGVGNHFMIGLWPAKANDFNGDGRSNLVLYNPDGGNWYIDGFTAGNVHWGYKKTVAVPGDYNGDGRGDYAVYDAALGQWYIRTLSGQTLAWDFDWGYSGTIPVPGDYNGDGKSDLAVYDPENGKWYIMTLSGEVLAWELTHGYAGAIPVPGDYNGDGKSDLAVYDADQGKWYIITLSGEVLAWDLYWGYSGTIPVSGDYNGDGKADLAVYDFENGKWYIQTLSGETLAWELEHGYSKAIPVPGDYNGDGKYDLAVYDSESTMWYIITLSGETLAWGLPFGQSAVGQDKPVALGTARNARESHLPILTGGECFLYKPDTSLVLLPARMRPNGQTPADRVVFARDPAGEDIIRELRYTGNFGSRPKWRFYGTRGSSLGSNFYVLAFFRDNSPHQPYLIHNGNSRQGHRHGEC